MSATKTPDLDKAIDRLIRLGEKEPLLIAKKLEKQYGPEWLAQQLFLYAEEFISDLARRRLNSIRRSAEIALRPGDIQASAELKLAKTWVPKVGWKVAATLTVSDLRAKAEWYRNFARSAQRRSAWCDEVADDMEAEGVVTLGELRKALPPLPDVRELEALPA